MPPIKKEHKINSFFPFLDKRKNKDLKIWETYLKYKKINGDKSHPATIKDMIQTIGKMMGLCKKRLLLSIEPTDKGYNVETVIDTTIIEKGEKNET